MNDVLENTTVAADLHRDAASCFHCGERCGDRTFAHGEKNFCCQGCRVVHDLLAESGLEHFYDLETHPGIRIRRPSAREQWAYLDEPAIQQRLLDFTDGQASHMTFHLPAIHCVACVWLLENLFRLHPGIGQSRVNFPKREVAIRFAPQKISLGELAALLASLGYEPALSFGELDKKPAATTARRQWLQVGVAGFAFGNIMLFSLPGYLGMDSFSGPVFKTLFGRLSLALALPSVIYSASDYWKAARLAVRRRALTLDIPIALGLAALYAESAFEVLSHRGDGYLDSLAGLIFFLLCGRVFQQQTHDRLAFDRDYKSFFPLSVTRVGVQAAACPGNTPRRESQLISLAQLEVGDRIRLRHGELIPADARLVSGDARIDYSFVTGESEPVLKTPGDYLYAGGQQTGGAIEIETVKPVSQSYLTSLWDHEAFRKNRDDNFNTLTNRYSRRFTRLVFGVAAGAVSFWLASGDPARALKAFTSVLIVACPCALALAAPFTLGTAQRRLARLGVFLRNALVTERLAQVDAIVFDKTGTLTTAGPAQVSFSGEPLAETEERWIASLTQHSTHPHSRRIRESLRTADAFAVRSFREIPGCGVEGVVNGRKVRLGSAAWLAANGAPAGGNGEARVHVAIDGRYRGAFALASALRPETDRLLRELSGRFEIALLSGDNAAERERFRTLFDGDARMHFNQSPLDKLGFIRRLQESGRTVMMVGDGLNDAGALKQSDVGVAVVETIGVFSPASDVILEAADVPRLAEILAFARRAARIVRWSFAVSAAYNLVGISIAAAGILSPLICAVLMPLSSISVVLFACGMTGRAAKRLKHRTPNIEHRTSKDSRTEAFDVRSSMFDVRCSNPAEVAP